MTAYNILRPITTRTPTKFPISIIEKNSFDFINLLKQIISLKSMYTHVCYYIVSYYTVPNLRFDFCFVAI